MSSGAGLDSSPELTKLYNEAWERYQARCLWFMRRLVQPTPEQARMVASYLRQHGDMNARKLASRIESGASRMDEHLTHDPAGLVISKVLSRFENDAEAWLWYGTKTVAALDNRTPAQMVAEGRVRELLHYLGATDGAEEVEDRPDAEPQ